MSGPLGVAYFLSYGQWELLALFVAALGPAEMVAWVLLGYLNAIFKYTFDGLADAAEISCSIHLVTNEPELAQISAGKSHFWGFSTSLFVTSLLYIAGMEFTQAISPDPTLQRLMMEVIPLLGIGNMVQSSGLISSSVLGAQERSGLAILLQFLCSWCLSILLGSIFVFGFRIDLQGIMSAVVLGMGLSSAGSAYVLLRSEWTELAYSISNGVFGESLVEG